MKALKHTPFALLAVAALLLASCRLVTPRPLATPNAQTPTGPVTHTLFIPIQGQGEEPEPEKGAEEITAAETVTTPVTYTLFLPAIVPGEPGQLAPTCNDVIRNGNFDGTSTGRPWTGVANTPSAVYAPTLLSSTRAHSGAQSGRVGSPSVNSFWNEMIQTVPLPGGVTSVTLVYWRFLDTTETSTTKVYDSFSAGLETEKGIQIVTPQQINNTSAGRGQWVKSTLALPNPAAYSRQRLWVTFKGRTDSNLPSSLYVDDVQLTVCATGW